MHIYYSEILLLLCRLLHRILVHRTLPRRAVDLFRVKPKAHATLVFVLELVDIVRCGVDIYYVGFRVRYID